MQRPRQQKRQPEPDTPPIAQPAPASASARKDICRRALAAVGALHSGLHDLAVEHDSYLAEAYAE